MLASIATVDDLATLWRLLLLNSAYGDDGGELDNFDTISWQYWRMMPTCCKISFLSTWFISDSLALWSGSSEMVFKIWLTDWLDWLLGLDLDWLLLDVLTLTRWQKGSMRFRNHAEMESNQHERDINLYWSIIWAQSYEYKWRSNCTDTRMINCVAPFHSDIIVEEQNLSFLLFSFYKICFSRSSCDIFIVWIAF